MDKLKLAVFGAWRGNSYVDIFLKHPKIELIAICDKNIANLENKDNADLKDVALFTEFDEFLAFCKEKKVNAMYLANYFHQHAPFAIRAMEAGMDVMSECTAASTMKECVELVEAVERTGRKYLLAENYPFMAANIEIKKIIDGGTLGALQYAEGEYNHTGDNAELARLTPGNYHWRAWLPRTYYITHTLGPVMYLTNSMPKYVCGRAAHSPLLYEMKDFRRNYDGVGMVFCEMDNGMIARVTGCTAMGSDYSRYRFCGENGGAEMGGYIGDGNVRVFYHEHTKPEDRKDKDACYTYQVDPKSAYGEEEYEAAIKTGHGGGDYGMVQKMVDCFLYGKPSAFDVYKSVAMSAVAILGWRSALNHGENMKIPDFRIKEERDAVRNDDLTPFPDENGEGRTLPPATKYPF